MMFGTISTLTDLKFHSTLMKGLTIVALSFFAACSQKSGPCEWDFMRVEAEVTNIEAFSVNEAGDSLYHVMMKFNGSVYSNKEQFMEELRDIDITRDVLRKNNIRIGNRYKATVSEIRSGNCKSPILSFDSKIRP